jgi:phage gp29-like protein
MRLCREMVGQTPGVAQAIFDLLDAIPKGFSVLEIDWQTDADHWRPARLLWRPQRWFQVADDGETLLLREAGGEGIELNPLNFIVHRVRARSGFCARTGLLRSCVRAFVVRHFAWKDWMAFAEVYGMPPRIGWLREDVPWDSQEARQLWQAVRALGMDSAAVMREGNRIEVLDTRSGGEGRMFERILDRAGREMTLAVLGQLLTSGGEKGGSYALGQVHNQVRWDLIESDALALGRTLTERLLRPLVRLNLGQKAPVPSWTFHADKPEDLSELARTVQTLSQAGLPIPLEWAYTKFGIPRPAEGEAVLHSKEGG